MSDNEVIDSLKAQVASLEEIIQKQKEYIEGFKNYLSGQKLVGHMVNGGFVSVTALKHATRRPDPLVDKVYTVYANMQEG